MKKYKIRNFGTDKYVVHKRVLLFLWCMERASFDSIEEAKDYIKKLEKAEYTEYTN